MMLADAKIQAKKTPAVVIKPQSVNNLWDLSSYEDVEDLNYVILISVGQAYCQGEELKATMNVLSMLCKHHPHIGFHFTIAVADTLQRYNHLAITGDPDDEKCKKDFREKGDEWVKANSAAWSNLEKFAEVTVVHWDKWIGEEEKTILEAIPQIKQEYDQEIKENKILKQEGKQKGNKKKEKTFKEATHDKIFFYWNAKDPEKKENKRFENLPFGCKEPEDFKKVLENQKSLTPREEKSLEYLKHYIFEEIAVFYFVWPKKNIHQIIYPKDADGVLDIARKKWVVKGGVGDWVRWTALEREESPVKVLAQVQQSLVRAQMCLEQLAHYYQAEDAKGEFGAIDVSQVATQLEGVVKNCRTLERKQMLHHKETQHSWKEHLNKAEQKFRFRSPRPRLFDYISTIQQFHYLKQHLESIPPICLDEKKLERLAHEELMTQVLPEKLLFALHLEYACLHYKFDVARLDWKGKPAINENDILYYGMPGAAFTLSIYLKLGENEETFLAQIKFQKSECKIEHIRGLKKEEESGSKKSHGISKMLRKAVNQVSTKMHNEKNRDAFREAEKKCEEMTKTNNEKELTKLSEETWSAAEFKIGSLKIEESTLKLVEAVTPEAMLEFFRKDEASLTLLRTELSKIVKISKLQEEKKPVDEAAKHPEGKGDEKKAEKKPPMAPAPTPAERKDDAPLLNPGADKRARLGLATTLFFNQARNLDDWKVRNSKLSLFFLDPQEAGKFNEFLKTKEIPAVIELEDKGITAYVSVALEGN